VPRGRLNRSGAGPTDVPLRRREERLLTQEKEGLHLEKKEQVPLMALLKRTAPVDDQGGEGARARDARITKMVDIYSPYLPLKRVPYYQTSLSGGFYVAVAKKGRRDEETGTSTGLGNRKTYDVLRNCHLLPSSCAILRGPISRKKKGSRNESRRGTRKGGEPDAKTEKADQGPRNANEPNVASAPTPPPPPLKPRSRRKKQPAVKRPISMGMLPSPRASRSRSNSPKNASGGV